jgi:broad specificity phosphatase PhoE
VLSLRKASRTDTTDVWETSEVYSEKGKAMKLFLLRHGETSFNAQNRAQGFSDPELTEVGRRQAQALANAFAKEALAAVYASDLKRAVETARFIAQPHGLTVQTDPGLREMNQGIFEGLSITEIRTQYSEMVEEWIAAPDHFAMPKGESLAQVQERAWASVQRIVAAHPEGQVIAVSHNLTIMAILCRVLTIDLMHFRRLHQDLAARSTIEFGPHGPTVTLLNDTCHLFDIYLPKSSKT